MSAVADVVKEIAKYGRRPNQGIKMTEGVYGMGEVDEVSDHVIYNTGRYVIHLRQRPDNNINLYVYDMNIPKTDFNETISMSDTFDRVMKYLGFEPKNEVYRGV